jgi:pyruvate,orthophosphate dikinase
MAKAGRWVYFFGNGKADGTGEQKELLGGKGAGLAEMTRIGLPVPPGFTITTTACDVFNQRAGKWPDGLEAQVRLNMKKMERAAGKKFGDPKKPLLVSVRSGAARSMPGMMETILNLGLNDATVEGLAKAASNRRFALDAYRRLIMMYGSTAKGVKRELFDRAFEEIKDTRTKARLRRGSDERILDTDADAEELSDLITQFKAIYFAHTGSSFPQDPFEQLKGAVDAVFNSWMAEKAVTYRRVERITGLKGTAVNVCQMVFGNMGDDSGTGVCFTRDPSTGAAEFYGDLLINAQGEDVVAGIRTPIHLSELHRLMPEVYDQLEAVRAILEVHYKDMQDLEFTIEQGTLYMLQCRTGKRSPQAAFKIAVDQATKGLLTRGQAAKLVSKRYLPKRYGDAATGPIITKDEAIQRIAAVDIERLFYPVLDPQLSHDDLSRRLLGEGVGAVPGAAAGEIAFSAEEAEERAKAGAKVILVRRETSPEDVGGMHVAAGILTATGGKTSHAAVVARGWGKCCIVGCDGLKISYSDKKMTLGGRTVRQGEFITLDGNSGRIYEGEIRLARPHAPPEFDTLLTWCDNKRRLRVRANADTPMDAIKAVELGAEGIGLCRTEHMFFDPSQPQRIRAMREMILASDEQARKRALDKLLPYQVDDFEGIFRAMNGRPVTIRLIDPPLHEFLPGRDNPQGVQAVVEELNGPLREELSRVSLWDVDARRSIESRLVTAEDIHHRVDALHEANPMLGHRGCRLCITFPEILDMQVGAIIEAAARCVADGVRVFPEIMIPLSIDPLELRILIERTRYVADHIIAERGIKLEYLVGTMVETPRAAITAGSMAEAAEFFSFGTNDLTQLTMGLSRDDAARFLQDYLSRSQAATTEPRTAFGGPNTTSGQPPLTNVGMGSAHRGADVFGAIPAFGGHTLGTVDPGAATSNLPQDGPHVVPGVAPNGRGRDAVRAKRKRGAVAPAGTFPPADLVGPIFADDPFQTLDAVGVGALVRKACEDGRATNKRIKLGICGEHGGDPKSIHFCEEVGLDYVSCSPFRVPIARLAAAQAVIAGQLGRPVQSRDRKLPTRPGGVVSRPRPAAKKAARSSAAAKSKKHRRRRARKTTGGLAALAKTRTQNKRRAKARAKAGRSGAVPSGGRTKGVKPPRKKTNRRAAPRQLALA